MSTLTPAAMSVLGAIGSMGKLAQWQLDRTIEGVAYTQRLGGKVEVLIDETIETLRAAQPVLHAVNTAIADGFLDEVREAVQHVDGLPDTMLDVRAAREAAEHLVGLVNTTLEQLDGLPGAKLVRKRINKLSANVEALPPGSANA